MGIEIGCATCDGEGWVESAHMTGYVSITAECPPDPLKIECEDCFGTGRREVEDDLPANKHCDDYIDDPAAPECLRKFLDHARSPAHGSTRDDPRPALFATYQGKRVRVVMASRLGDVGITTDLAAERGYQCRVAVEDLTDFSANQHAPKCGWQFEQYPNECTCPSKES